MKELHEQATQIKQHSARLIEQMKALASQIEEQKAIAGDPMRRKKKN